MAAGAAAFCPTIGVSTSATFACFHPWVPTLHPLRAADLMIRRHGPAAAAEAEARRQELLARGDAARAEAWRQVVDAIRELERPAPREGEPVH